MLSLTKKALEEFDNQHDFERMCADILNALGYKEVVLIAPKGGSDGGRDITFSTEDGGKGLACVTLRMDIDKKFDEDFTQRKKGDYQKYIFYTHQYLSADQKKKYIRYCLDSLDAELIAQDIEALRSLLDSALKEIRQRYLHIADDRSLQIKKQLTQFLLLPKALSTTNYQDRAGYTEWRLTQPVHRETFYYIANINQDELREIPQIGTSLLNYQKHYYIFKELTDELTDKARAIIGKQTETHFQFTNGWSMYYDYFLFRVTGKSEEEAQSLIPLNYGITFPECERVFNLLRNTQEINYIVENIKVEWREISSIFKELGEYLLKP